MLTITHYRPFVKSKMGQFSLNFSSILKRLLKLGSFPHLWYNIPILGNIPATSSAPLCNQCGSKLIRVTKKTQKIEGQKFPITVITYKCSNKECQKKIDKERQERIRKEEERMAKKQPRV